MADTAWLALPGLVVVTAVAAKWGSPAAAVVLLALGAGAAALVARRRASRFDDRWLVAELDARRPDFEDSTDLLLASSAPLSPLQRLQQARVQARVESGPLLDLRPPWSLGPGAVGLVMAAFLVAAVAMWPSARPVTVENAVALLGGGPVAPTRTRLASAQLGVEPPAYTRQAARAGSDLSAKAPAGTRLHWTLRFDPQPEAASLVFHDGRRVELARDGDDWRARDVLVRSALYRIELDRAAPPLHPAARHRLDAVADRAPQVRVLEPDRNLSLVTPGQRHWAVAFEADDDYGVSPTGTLTITLAQGSGETITFRERSVSLRGSGLPSRRRFAQRLDLASLGFASGDDLIVRFAIADNRTPSPQTARSASLILRWPSDLGTETTGLDGMVKKTLPAYFRSQRQIIIDAEALLKQRRSLDAERFVQRSDAIGVDQRILRLRYGQFLGEEAEGEPAPPPLPTNDAPAEGESAGDHDDAGPAGAPRDEHGHAAGHDHGEESESPPAAFGRDGGVLAEFGHTHDEAEAATLLDPGTRTTLKAALDQMWQSELHLRQGEPAKALPFANRALGFIKQVQQATRIYVARVGPELPPIDESRRLTGERGGLSRPADPLTAATAPDPTLAALWRSLDETPTSGDNPRAVDFAALERWLREHPDRAADPLAFVAAIESLRASPGCVPCRRELRALVWPLLPRPPAAVPRRDGAGEAGRRYLDALREERAR
ncbi:DUF4175 domain-containing protein [Cognatilysobacter bugurensis]|uniref:DUF4175 domain-containing protein n=1 Tax=Cognatilysobacter bugurensis TaxID=543356 RepID=UPI001E28FDE3|nr:DUF4175 domain-containing protein [Lysobacter bugurensis]